MDIFNILITLLVAVLVYFVAALILPYPIPAILAILVIVLGIFGRGFRV